MQEEQPEADEHAFGWRQLMGAVNIRDFLEMVGGEVVQIGSSFRLALESLTRLPFGPVIGLVGILLLLLRLVLLVLFVVTFGTGILVVSLIRRLRGGGAESSAPS